MIKGRYLIINLSLWLLSIGTILFSGFELYRLYTMNSAIARDFMGIIGIAMIVLGIFFVVSLYLSTHFPASFEQQLSRSENNTQGTRFKTVILLGFFPIVLGFGKKIMLIFLTTGLAIFLLVLFLWHFW